MYKVGEEHPTIFGDSIRILEYKNYDEVFVRFNQTGFEDWFSSTNIKKGKMKDKLRVSVKGFGFFGVGPYGGPRECKAYTYWLNMLRRCYTDSGVRCYEDVWVHPKWANYQTFADWCTKQSGYGIEGWHLDKDWFSSEDKIYSEETCIFVPPELNYFLINTEGESGKRGFTKSKRYAASKEQKAKELAAKYKDQIDQKLFNKLNSYVVKEKY